MTWLALIWKNLFRRPARTVFTAVGVGLGVGLIVALLSITNGVHRTADDLTHVGRADFGLYQSDVTDFTRSLLPESLAARVAADPGVASVAKVKLLVDDGMLVFGLDPSEFAYRRLVVTEGRRGRGDGGRPLAPAPRRGRCGSAGIGTGSQGSTTPATGSRISGWCCRSTRSSASRSGPARSPPSGST